MSIPWRDRIATLLVAAATLIYLLWLTGPLAGLTASSIAVLVLALGSSRPPRRSFRGSLRCCPGQGRIWFSRRLAGWSPWPAA